MKKTILNVYFRSERCDKSSGAYLQHEVTKEDVTILDLQ